MNLLSLSPRLLEALLNGGGQGLVVTAVVALVLRGLPRINAATRHAVWFACLLVVAALPVAHFILSPRAQTQPEQAAEAAAGFAEPGVGRQVAPGFARVEEVTRPPVSIPLEESLGTASETFQNTGDPGAWSEIRTAGRNQDLVPTPPALGPDRLVETQGDQPRGRTVRVTEEPFVPGLGSGAGLAAADSSGERAVAPAARWKLEWPRWLADGLVLAWAAVVTFRLGCLGRECVRLGMLKRGATGAGDETQALFARVGMSMGLKRPARLRIGPEDVVPLVAGFWRPTVVIPAGFLEANSKERVTQVFSHELAHIHRRDDWSNLVEQGIRAVMFFNPAIWWIAEQLSLDREIACDDHVLATTHQARNYALLLTDFAGRRHGRELIAAPAVWKKKTQLKERIVMILDSKRNASPRMAGTMTGLLLLVIAGFTGVVLHAAPRVALADGETSVEASTRVVADRSIEVSTDPSVVTDLTPPAELPVEITVVTAPEAVLSVTAADVFTGPRYKSPPAPVVPANPLAPAPVALPASPAAPPRPMVAPAPRSITIARSSGDTDDRSDSDSSSRKGRKNGTSVEERIDRLERMMEKLLAAGGTAPVPPGWGALNPNFNRDAHAKMADEARKLALSIRPGTDEASLAELREKAERQAEKAVRDAERATARIQREQERSAAKQLSELSMQYEMNGRQQLESQRKALESARRSLEQQLKSLEKQIERIESDQEHLDDLLEKPAKKAAKEKSAGSSAAEPPAGASEGSEPPKAKF